MLYCNKHPDQDEKVMRNAKEFGHLIQITRKKSGLTQASLAAASGVGERFIRELEKGKASCQLEKALLVASMLGIKFEAIPPAMLREKS